MSPPLCGLLSYEPMPSLMAAVPPQPSLELLLSIASGPSTGRLLFLDAGVCVVTAKRVRARPSTGPCISHCWVYCLSSMGINPAVPVTSLKCFHYLIDCYMKRALNLTLFLLLNCRKN